MKHGSRITAGIVAGALALAAMAAWSQAFPNRPAKLVSAFPPGGGSDGVARILAPTGTPPAVNQKLNAETGRARLAERAGAARGAALRDPDRHTPATFGELIRRDLERWSKLANEAGIKGD